MGFAKGTDVFDPVVSYLKKYKILESKRGAGIVKVLYSTLRDLDWDTFHESDYYEDFHVRIIVEKIEPSQYEEE